MWPSLKLAELSATSNPYLLSKPSARCGMKKAAKTPCSSIVTLVPWIAAAQELKTKPTQHSVKELRAIGHSARHAAVPLPSAILSDELKEKIALFCDVDDRSNVITARDVPVRV